MDCKNCKECKWGTIIHTCRVCELNDNDSSKKPVCHCDICKAYICQKHWGWNTPLERAEAAAREVVETVIKVAKKLKKKFKTDDFGKDDQAKITA